MRRHVYFYTHLEQGFDALAQVLGGDPAAWLPKPAEPRDEGWLVDLHAHGTLPAGVAGHTALASVGEPSLASAGHPETLLRSVAWQSATTERLVPMLEADLELASLDAYGCQLSMMGSYRPPLSVIGEAGDRLLGHRVAEACVRRFVLDIADRLVVSATLSA